MNLTGGGAFYSQTPESSLEDLGVNKGVNEASLVMDLSRSDCGLENTLCHSERSEESQSCMQKMVSSLTPIPSPIWRGENKPAFTLAEILITLGVIGIIAAMTLPMLARNYNFYIRQQQFKKAYAALNIAVQKTQIDMGEGVNCFYAGRDYKGDFAKSNDCSYFYNEVLKNLNVIKICHKEPKEKDCLPNVGWRGGELVYKEQQGQDRQEMFERDCRGFSTKYINEIGTVYVLNSGLIILPYSTSLEMDAPIFAADVNGKRGPNKWGHDIFIFDFKKVKNSDSIFILEPSVRCHPIERGGYYTKTFFQYLYGQNAEL